MSSRPSRRSYLGHSRRVVLLFAIVLGLGAAALGCESEYDRRERLDAEAKAKYLGARFEEIVAARGEPASTEEFRLDDGAGEFQIELLNLDPPDAPETADRDIREARWPERDDFLVVWFEQRAGIWIAVDAAIMDTSVAY